MADSELLRNLTAAAMQMACLAVLAEALLRLVPVAAAGFRYAYWRAVLAAALVAPWVLRGSPDLVPAPSLDMPVSAVALPSAEAMAAVASGGTDWFAVVPWLLALGTALRVVWLVAGFVRLRALRQSGVVVDEADYDDLQERLGARADMRAVAALAQPVTFGIRRPVILLPITLADADPAIRRAAVAHELVHVRRRDWLFVLVEELLRALFWFHPAIWWMTARVRLTREEFTDHLAVLAIGSRRSYIDALLAFADAPRAPLAPAFIRRAHLFDRIVLLTKEPSMSSRRIALSGIVLALLLGAGGWYVTDAFPVRASVAGAFRAPVAAQQPTGATAIVRAPSAENPIPRRLFAPPIPYPLELAGTGFESALSIRVVVDATGSVQSASAGARAVAVAPGRRQPLRSESEAMELFAVAATDAIARWQYEPPVQPPIAFYLAVVFKPDSPATVAQSERSQGVRAGPEGARMLLPEELVEMNALSAPRRASTPTAAGGAGTQGRGTSRSVAEPGRAIGGPPEPQRVAPPPPTGSAAGPVAPSAANAAAARRPAIGEVDTITVTDRDASGRVVFESAPRELTLTVSGQAAPPLPIGGGVPPPVQVRKVSPVYPEEARAARVQGIVILEALVSERGNVENIRVLRSIPMLDQAAIDAVRQWQYAPTLLNGKPVPIIMTVTVQFTLS